MVILLVDQKAQPRILPTWSSNGGRRKTETADSSNDRSNMYAIDLGLHVRHDTKVDDAVQIGQPLQVLLKSQDQMSVIHNAGLAISGYFLHVVGAVTGKIDTTQMLPDDAFSGGGQNDEVRVEALVSSV